MKQVQLTNAFWWTCPSCKSENLEKGQDVPIEDVILSTPDPEERKELEEMFKQGGLQGEFMMQPKTVLCPKCFELCETKDSV